MATQEIASKLKLDLIGSAQVIDDLYKTLQDFSECEIERWDDFEEALEVCLQSHEVRIIVADEQSLIDIPLSAYPQLSRTRVLALVERASESQERRWLRLGCMGVVKHSAPISVILQSMRAIAADEIWASRRVMTTVLKEFVSAGPSFSVFTRREVEILELIASGRNNREIADALFISRETVRWHLRALYGKIGVHSRSQASAAASRLLRQAS